MLQKLWNIFHKSWITTRKVHFIQTLPFQRSILWTDRWVALNDDIDFGVNVEMIINTSFLVKNWTRTPSQVVFPLGSSGFILILYGSRRTIAALVIKVINQYLNMNSHSKGVVWIIHSENSLHLIEIPESSSSWLSRWHGEWLYDWQWM